MEIVAILGNNFPFNITHPKQELQNFHGDIDPEGDLSSEKAL